MRCHMFESALPEVQPQFSPPKPCGVIQGSFHGGGLGISPVSRCPGNSKEVVPISGSRMFDSGRV